MDTCIGAGKIPGNLYHSVEPNDGWFAHNNDTGVGYICIGSAVFHSGNRNEWHKRIR